MGSTKAMSNQEKQELFGIFFHSTLTCKKSLVRKQNFSVLHSYRYAVTKRQILFVRVQESSATEQILLIVLDSENVLGICNLQPKCKNNVKKTQFKGLK